MNLGKTGAQAQSAVTKALRADVSFLQRGDGDLQGALVQAAATAAQSRIDRTPHTLQQDQVIVKLTAEGWSRAGGELESRRQHAATAASRLQGLRARLVSDCRRLAVLPLQVAEQAVVTSELQTHSRPINPAGRSAQASSESPVIVARASKLDSSASMLGSTTSTVQA